MREIRFSEDPYQMNWLREDYAYGEVICPGELESRVENSREGDLITTRITITNPGGKPVFTTVDSIAIAFPLQDKYDGSDICMKERCHAHIFCGGDISYIMALRMGGEPPHLGMVLTEGSLAHYSIRRDTTKRSNDRGCFYLHPAPMELAAGESRVIQWTIFPHQGKADFRKQRVRHCRYVDVQAERYVLFPGERIRIAIRPGFDTRCVKVNGEAVPSSEGVFYWEETAAEQGERIYQIEADGVHTWCRVYVHAPLEKLLESRCRFIAERQQYQGKIRQLKGAYLTYDNEEKHMVYRPVNDYNGGRERVGMGVLLSRFLQSEYGDEGHVLEKSLQEYVEYVLRELVDGGSGRVYNDIGRDLSYRRLYNFPWFATFFLELYRQYGKREYVIYAYRILKLFYAEGGTGFYPIDLPVLQMAEVLEQEGMVEELREMMTLFTGHGQKLMETGLRYPASEVNYEQSIVAPAADILLQVYLLTKEAKYLEATKQQIEVLDLFNGEQPDYHLHETAIRHWDGYWFGKYGFYGDTFPHYWSALTGNVFALYARVTGEEEYAARAENSLRGVLPMIFPDGSASCACLYPYRVNDVRVEGYDPYANDQDWGLYFYLRSREGFAGAENP